MLRGLIKKNFNPNTEIINIDYPLTFQTLHPKIPKLDPTFDLLPSVTQESTKKFIGWPRYSHGMWLNEV